MKTPQELLAEAIEFIEEAREMEFVANEVDGAVTDSASIIQLDLYDRWLGEARHAVTENASHHD